jgi:hypothetical protein
MSNTVAPVELDEFLQRHPGTRMIETLNVDAHGILRGKRIARMNSVPLRKVSVAAPAPCLMKGALSRARSFARWRSRLHAHPVPGAGAGALAGIASGTG